MNKIFNKNNEKNLRSATRSDKNKLKVDYHYKL